MLGCRYSMPEGMGGLSCAILVAAANLLNCHLKRPHPTYDLTSPGIQIQTSEGDSERRRVQDTYQSCNNSGSRTFIVQSGSFSADDSDLRLKTWSLLRLSPRLNRRSGNPRKCYNMLMNRRINRRRNLKSRRKTRKNTNH